MKAIISVVVALSILSALTITQRHRINIALTGADGPPELLNSTDGGPNVRWHDDYFTVQVIDANTFAIGEPRYFQQNFNYLIVGAERAILFDAGSGYRDIRPVAAALTDLPITFVPSHFHYDHIGNNITFDRVAVIDLPHIRERVVGDKLQLRWQEHLGGYEGYDAPVLTINEWLSPGGVIELGDRSLRIIFTPGHTDDSISLVDESAELLFAGDFIYPGSLYAFMPNSNMGDYLQGADSILDTGLSAMRIFGAHRAGPPGAPEQSISDVRDLQATLQMIKSGDADGEGLYPVTYYVNPGLQMLADPPFLQQWDARYPELSYARK